jgi:hypothetical protein
MNDDEDPGRAISRLWPSIRAVSILFGALAGSVTSLVTLWAYLDAWNLRFVFKYELTQQGLFISREILRDRMVHHDSFTNEDLIKYCRLSESLNIKAPECPE